jgi:hypothetical protein
MTASYPLERQVHCCSACTHARDAQPLLARRVYDNVLRFGAGRPLLGTVDLDAGY